MKRLISISLLFIMLGYSFIQLSVFIEYVSDIESYTEKYCVNKEKPEKKCNGKCHLTEELSKNEEQKQHQEVQSPPEVLLFKVKNTIEIAERIEFQTNQKPIVSYTNDYLKQIIFSIFHPPEF